MRKRRIDEPTTIKVSRDVMVMLRSMKTSTTETYNDVIKKIIKKINEDKLKGF
jgi:predicted CopG family antitoxin